MGYQSSNFLQSNNFQMVIPSFEVTRFMATSFQLPNVMLPSAAADTPFSRMSFAGDKMSFEPFSFRFIIDELMLNYTEIFTWMTSIGYAEDFDQFTNYELKSGPQPLGEQDIKVMILNSNNNTIATVTFYNAIPVSLSMVEPLDTAVQDVSYLTGNVTFDYDYYRIELTSPEVYHKQPATPPAV